jgi:hypothetical protein
MKRLLIAAGLAACAVALSGCSIFAGEPDPKTGEDTALEVRHVQVDNRIVTCVVYRSMGRGGVSCDWAGAVKR